MQKKNLKPLMLSALAAVAMAGVGTGATFALFTDKAETTINVEAGKVKIAKSVTTPALHSAKADPNGTILDEYGNKYAEQEGWVNGGTAAFDADGVLKLEKMTPGDRVSFGVGFTNESNVNILYRFVLKAANPTDYLAAGLQTKIGAQTYQGLLSYRSAWTLLAPGATPVELGDIEMYLPLTSGNIFQGLSANYILTIEAVQGNASVNDEAGAEIAQYVPQATIVDSQKKATLEYAKEKEQTASTTVELDFSGDQSAAEAGQEVSLGVVTRDVIQNAGSFVVETDKMAAAAIDLKLYVDGQAATQGFNAKITTNVAKNLTSVGLKYNGTSGVFSQGGKLVSTVAEVNEPGKYWYDAGTGALVFMTNHFSEYYVVANNIVAYNRNSTSVYTSFVEAYGAASKGDTIVILQDLDLTDQSLYNAAGTSGRIMLEKSMTIDGNGHTITLKNRGFGLTGEIMTFRNVTMVNSTAYGRILDTRGNISKLNLENVNLLTPATVSQPLTIGGYNDEACEVNIASSVIRTKEDYSDGYAIMTFNPVKMTIKDSTIGGWGCVYLKAPNSSAGSKGSVVTIEDSALWSKNVYSGVSNAFSAFVFEDDGCQVNVSGTDIHLNAIGDQRQAVYDFAKDKKDNALNLSNCTVYLEGEAKVDGNLFEDNTVTKTDVVEKRVNE